MVVVAHLGKFTKKKNHWIVPLKWVHFIAYKWYLHKDIWQKNRRKKEAWVLMENWASWVSNVWETRWSVQCTKWPSPAWATVVLLQSCLPGYYRVDGILFGGICQPCECHGHAAECDIHGVCFVSPLLKPWMPPPTHPKAICYTDMIFKKYFLHSRLSLPLQTPKEICRFKCMSLKKRFPAFYPFFKKKKLFWW